MGKYMPAQICLNGHVITKNANALELTSKYCKKCGQPTIDKCPGCGAMIRGEYYVPGFIGISNYEVPAFCSSCGKPYPWTESFLKSADQIVDSLEDLTTDQRKALKETFPDLIVETPKSQVQALNAAKLLNTTKALGKDFLLTILKDHAIESVIKLLGI